MFTVWVQKGSFFAPPPHILSSIDPDYGPSYAGGKMGGGAK